MSSWTHSNIERAPVSEFEPATLVELLRRRALREPERRAYTFLPDGETEEEHTSYGGLRHIANTVAATLQSANASGQRVLLLFPPGLDYIAAFFGCLYAGAVAVPSYPPPLNSLSQLHAIATDARANVALTTAAMYSRVEKHLSGADSLASLRWLTNDSIPIELAADWQEPVVGGNTLAFLQYTSGSTSAPKGVMVTHSNLLHNESIIQQVFRQTEASVIVGWLPFYHDMGLIGNVLQPLYLGARAILMSPMAFLQRPLRWLEAISQYRASTSGGPNFAYELCIRKSTPEQRLQLDLSTWRVAFNGAETVRAETLDRFAETFAPCGFRKEAFYPCYGLAEATLLVSGHKRTSLPVVSAANRVSCGQVAQTVVIVDPDSLNECTPGQVGEIWVNGAGVAMGYWNNPVETEHTFSAHLSKTGAGPFMRTGDLGFLEDGELFVTGRLKDLIIIRGLNHYPQDIELSVETSHTELRRGCGAAFSVEVEGEEQLVVVQEVSNHSQSDLHSVIETIRSVVSTTHEVHVYAVVLIRKGTIPKTTSGKIRRRACREQFLKGSLNTVAEWRQTAAQPPDISETPDLRSAASIREWLVQHLAARLGIKQGDIDLNQPLTRYGLDSLQAIELVHEMELSLKVRLPMASLLESPSIAALIDQGISPIAESFPASQYGAEHPLSYGQRALWFLQQMDPESAAYNLSFAARLGADLDVDRLGRAFQQLVNRHASLRTTFTNVDGQPVQHIQNAADVYFDIEDASDWSEDLLTERLAHEVHRPFDLELGPMLCVHVFKRPKREHLLLLVVHHVISDFWSLAILMHELGTLYAGEDSASPTLQYVDYSQWQAEMLTGLEGDRLWNYWRNELSGELPVVNLPSDRPRPPVQSHRGATRIFHVNHSVTQKLKDLSNTHGTTLYMTLLAAFYVLLYRYTGQEDLLVGSPTTGRNQARWANVAGYFVNPLVLRSEISGSWTFETFLARVRVTVLLAFHHQDYPFALLVERLQPQRDPSRSPLFQIMFLLQKAHLLNDEGFAPFALGEAGARMKLGGLELESIGLEQRTAIFDLMLMMTETEDGLAGSLQYNTDLFDEATITRLASHFNNLLSAVVGDPSQTLATLPLLDEDERSQLVTDWNRTQASYPRTSCIHELFEVQVERTPDSVAVIDEHQRLSYRELNDKANQVAHYLRRQGVKPETRVGVMAERRIEMVIALLGVLKSGGAYVPLDAQYPRERLEYMLKDSGAEVLLTTRGVGVDLETGSIRRICVEEEELERENSKNIESGLESRNLAYVIYTSGSTGRPKGVAIEHQSAVTFLYWVKDVFSAEELSGVLASTSICFDLSVFELFAPLSWGGKVILADNVLQLPVLKAREEVSLINTVP